MDILETAARAKGYLAWQAEFTRGDWILAFQTIHMVVDRDYVASPLERANARRVRRNDMRPWYDQQFREMLETALDCWPTELGGYHPCQHERWGDFLDEISLAIRAG